MLHLVGARPDPEALGGVAIHVAALARHMAEWVTVHTAHPTPTGLSVTRWSPNPTPAALIGGGDAGSGPGLCAALTTALLGTRSNVLFVHSPMLGPAAIRRATETAGAGLVLSVHDGALVCENHELLEGGRRFCGIPEDLARCDACLSTLLGRKPGSVSSWRVEMGALVSAAARVIAPSESALDVVCRVHPGARERARIVPWGVPAPRVRFRGDPRGNGPLRIAVVSVWARAKGAERLPALFAACSGLDVEWHLFGATEGASLSDVQGSAPRVVLHGAYRRAKLAERLVQSGCQIVLLPSVAAETFSLVLSEVTALGLPVLASDLGALSERVRRDALGWLFDPWRPESLDAVVRELLVDRAALQAAQERLSTRPVRTERTMAEDHVRLARELSVDAPSGLPDDPDREPFLAEFGRGERRARGVWSRGLSRLVNGVRKTDTYRDLRVRKLLSERTRLTVEHSLLRLFSWTRSR